MTGSRFRWGASTHVGQVRDINQDDMFATDGVYVVADGMGGHRGGEVASEVTVTTIRERSAPADLPSLLDGISEANSAVLERASSDPSLSGMGTTVCAVVLIEEPQPHLVIVNVGDSRVYRFADGNLNQVTEDHSLVETLVREGQLSAEEAAVHPQRNILTRALGVSLNLDIDYWEVAIRQGDRYVLCSDGLFNEVVDDQLRQLCAEIDDPQELADTLVERANAQGGRDNITVLVVDVAEGGDGPPPDFGPPQVAQRGAGWDAVEASVSVDETRGVIHDASPDTHADEPPATTVADDAGRAPSGRRRRFLVSLLFVLAVLAVLGLGSWLIGYYARSNYFVGFDGNDQVVIYQGRPGGVLWFDPTIEEPSGLYGTDLTPQLQDEVANNPEFDSLDGARNYVAELPDRADLVAGSDTDGPAATPTGSPRPTAAPTATPAPSATPTR